MCTARLCAGARRAERPAVSARLTDDYVGLVCESAVLRRRAGEALRGGLRSCRNQSNRTRTSPPSLRSHSSSLSHVPPLLAHPLALPPAPGRPPARRRPAAPRARAAQPLYLRGRSRARVSARGGREGCARLACRVAFPPSTPSAQRTPSSPSRTGPCPAPLAPRTSARPGAGAARGVRGRETRKFWGAAEQMRVVPAPRRAARRPHLPHLAPGARTAPPCPRRWSRTRGRPASCQPRRTSAPARPSSAGRARPGERCGGGGKGVVGGRGQACQAVARRTAGVPARAGGRRPAACVAPAPCRSACLRGRGGAGERRQAGGQVGFRRGGARTGGQRLLLRARNVRADAAGQPRRARGAGGGLWPQEFKARGRPTVGARPPALGAGRAGATARRVAGGGWRRPPRGARGGRCGPGGGGLPPPHQPLWPPLCLSP